MLLRKIRISVMLMVLLLQGIFVSTAHAIGVGGSGMYQWSVDLRGYVSNETGKAPVAYLWVPEGCKQVKAVLLSQQNMTEEAIYKNKNFQTQMKKLGVAMVWVAPAFTNNWDPTSGAQNTFEEMMDNLADQSGHAEIAKSLTSYRHIELLHATKIVHRQLSLSEFDSNIHCVSRHLS